MPAWNAFTRCAISPIASATLKAACCVQRHRAAEREILADPLDKQTWRIDSAAALQCRRRIAELVRYSIQWDDPGPFNSQLNAHHAFINFAEILMYVPDRRAEDTEVTFEDVPADWKLAAELPAWARMPTRLGADSYDALVDAPVEAGKFEDFAFDNQGAHFRVVVDGTEWNKGRLDDFLQRITTLRTEPDGRAHPSRSTRFSFTSASYADVGGGGMEHANSTAIAATQPKARRLSPRTNFSTPGT